MWSKAEEERNRAACIRQTITGNPRNSDLSPREVDRAVERGMQISDGSGRLTWGDIADAATATVRGDRGR